MSVRTPLISWRWLGPVFKVTLSVAILAAGGITLYVFGQKPEIEKKDDAGQFAGALVETLTAVTYDDPIIVEVDGEAATYRVVEVGAEVSGRITFKAEESRGGHYVQAGDLLFRIDDETYAIEVEQQQAQLALIDEELRALNVDLDNVSTLITLSQEDLQLQQERYLRTKRLFERSATSETEFDNAKRDELAARNALQKLRNELSSKQQQRSTTEIRRKVTEVTLKRAKLDLDRCRIEAPINGRVVEDVVEQGNFVAPGQLLTRISDASRMEVRCQLQASEVAWIWKQQVESMRSGDVTVNPNDPIALSPVPCEIVYEFGGMETVWQAKLTRFDGTGLSRQTRTFPARVIVENPEQTRTRSVSGDTLTITPPTLLSGLFVTVRIPVDLQESLLQVPLEAVRPGSKLWLNVDGQLKIIDAALVRAVGNRALIRQNSQLDSQSRIIVSPLASIQAGMPVRERTSDAAIPTESRPPDDNPNDAVKPETDAKAADGTEVVR